MKILKGWPFGKITQCLGLLLSLILRELELAIESFINCTDNKTQFCQKILQLHYLGGEKYDLMGKNEAEEAKKICRLLVKEEG